LKIITPVIESWYDTVAAFSTNDIMEELSFMILIKIIFHLLKKKKEKN